jgi:hypothetical protein
LGTQLVKQNILDKADDIYLCPASLCENALPNNGLNKIRAAVKTHKESWLNAKQQRTPEWVYGEANPEKWHTRASEWQCGDGYGA